MRISVITTVVLSTLLTACASYKTTQEKFVAVDSKFVAVDSKFVDVDSKFASVEKKVVNLESSVSSLEVENKKTFDIAQGKFSFTKEMPEVTIPFNAGQVNLSKDSQEQLTALVSRLQTENRNVYIEIQGHTDSMASASSKKQLGANRAEVVRLFLNQAGVDLNRMSTISYADQLPVESNKTSKGRVANRRVVIKIVN
jgi:outer membrane protein OmpA-like peptidoglycan-associated protein